MLLFDFGADGAIDDWLAINDGVMGGLSSGRLELAGNAGVAFVGRVSLENNGGFASVRSRPWRRDLSAYSGLVIRIRGDGKRYKINLKTMEGADGILYRAAFETREGEWQTLRIPFGEFVPTFRGRLVPGAPPLDLARITSVGLMISDKQAGPFRLEVARIEAYAD